MNKPSLDMAAAELAHDTDQLAYTVFL
jgi:hypothetical protein